MLRRLFQTSSPSSQPFVISGSGTLGWDLVAANLVKKGDDVLVLHTGYFGDSFADCFATYGVDAKQLKAPIGDRPGLDVVEAKLKEKQWKMITITHVDTSTGVLSDVKAVSELVHRVSPNTLVVADSVCAVGSEEICFDDWGLDVVLTASQKGIGCPPGLCIVMCSERAMQAYHNRQTPPTSYFASMKNWLPSMHPCPAVPSGPIRLVNHKLMSMAVVMQNYEAKKPSYFATPPTQLITSLHTSLTQILSRPLSDRFAAHRAASQRIKKVVSELGLKQLAEKQENQANGMTAMYLPNDLKGPDVLPKILNKGVIFAAGLHREIAPKYIRFGHMGVSVTDPKRDDIEKALNALKEGLLEVGYEIPK